ncbi:MAG: MFS transporter [Alphaproteobacteria bacterium]|nr:MFS transporter [Alphaproteobacteria bacterium]
MPSSPEAGVAPESGAGLCAAAAAENKRWLLALPDFRRLWLIGLVVFAVRWLEMLVVGVFVYQHTGSAFEVAMMTLLRMAPMVMFGPLIGALVESRERRPVQVAACLCLLVIASLMAMLAYRGALEVWHLALASFCNGVAWAADNPVRRVMIGEVVGPERMGAAMATDVGANNASRMLGPTIGGFVLATFGIAGAFTISVACYALALAAALRLRHRNALATGASGAVLAHIIEGLLLARRDPRLVALLTVTVIYNVFGWPFTSMIPVIGQDNLHLEAGGIGVLASMDGIGSFVGAIAIALWVRQAHFTRLYITAVLSYLVLLMGFALAPHPLFAGGALVLTGLANSGFSVMQATLIYLAAPAEMRSRLYGVLSLCIGSGLVGFLLLGAVAELVGAPAATALSGVEGLLVLALTWRWWRQLFRRG